MKYLQSFKDYFSQLNEGSWGTYPKDSDGALDLQGIINNSINKELENITIKYEGYHYAGLIMLLLQKEFFIKYKFIQKALEYIEKELFDLMNGNPKGWEHPQKTIKDITLIMEAFKNLLNKQKKFYMTTDKMGGKDITHHSKDWRIKQLENSKILAPVRWLERKGDRIKLNSSGLGYV